MKQSTSQIFLSPLFLIGLFLLLLNDFVLKDEFHNFLTGKISDFARLFVFALFWMSFFPKRPKLILISTAIFFSFWKSLYSQTLINFWNSFEVYIIGRTVDYTDLFALLVLPLAYLYSKKRESNFSINLPFKKLSASFVILISLFAFIATSDAREKSIHVEKMYVLTLTKAEFENLMKQNQKIQDLMIQDTNSNSNFDAKSNSNKYFIYFSLNYKICDSQTPRVGFLINDFGHKLVVETPSVRFMCYSFARENSNIAIQEYTPIVKTIFEEEIIRKLNPNALK